MLGLRLTSLGAAAVVAMSGCGADDPPPGGQRATDGNTNASTVAVSTSGKTDRVGRQADPVLVRPGRPGETVLRLWRFLKAGVVPAALLEYSGDVRKRVGLLPLAGAAADLQAQLAGYEPSVASATGTAAGQLVVLRAQNQVGPSLEYSYLLRRSGNRWKVVFDTLMQSALQTHVRTRVQNSTNASAATRDRQASDAAARATDRFRAASVVTKRPTPNDTSTPEPPQAPAATPGVPNAP